MHTYDSLFPPELEAKIVRCVEEAVGNDIQADIRNADLVGTHNSVPARIWDIMNRNLLREINAQECTIGEARTGPWQMLVIFEKSTSNIITLMREKRFADVRRYQRRRKGMHYLDLLTKQFNTALLADQEQLTFIPHTFSNENKLAELVQALLRELGGDADIVQNHVLVLFETVGDQLVHIRAVKVTPSLDIAKGCEWDWSKYVSGVTSAVVEKVDRIDSPENQPNRGLVLTGKALVRKEGNLRRKSTDPEKRKES